MSKVAITIEGMMKRSENSAKEKPFLSSAFRRLHAVSHILRGYLHTSRIQGYILFQRVYMYVFSWHCSLKHISLNVKGHMPYFVD